ncbi:MAG: hypothetical protein ABJA98_26270 [Acidobacteriota bacterium]
MMTTILLNGLEDLRLELKNRAVQFDVVGFLDEDDGIFQRIDNSH